VKLYKVTKIQYRRDFNYRTNTASGEWKVFKKRVDYRANKGAVTLACKFAEEQNAAADSNPNLSYRYEVQIEVSDLPEFQPATFCALHGVQPMLNVPGLTTELTCVECI
jgi:hypothetical protein